MSAVNKQAIKAEAQKIYNYFQPRLNYKYEKVLGRGGYGVTFLIKQTTKKGAFVRKLVVKRALGVVPQRSVLRELRVLEMLIGAEHIMQPIILPDAPVQQELEGPTLVSEYLANGTLGRFILRTAESKERAPNRILWRIFLCLIRMCLAMAYPPNYPANKDLIPENWPVNDLKHEIQIMHDDMHDDNLMFGDLNPGKLEHYIVPILKLIDFGLARTYNLLDREQARELRWRDIDETNIFAIGKLMVDIIIQTDSGIDRNEEIVKFTDIFSKDEEEVETYAAPLFEEKDDDVEMKEGGDDEEDDEPAALDEELLTWIARCLASDNRQVPTLEQLENAAMDGMLKWDHPEFNAKEGEPDWKCQDFVKRHILDAPTGDRTLENADMVPSGAYKPDPIYG